MAACLIWGSYGLFVRILPYPPEIIVFFRFSLGALCLLLFAGFTGRLTQLRPGSQWKNLAFIAFINTVSWLSLTYSITYTGVANGFILYYTAPCFVVLLAPLLLKETLERKSLVALALAFTGILLITGLGELNQGSHVILGNVLGVLSGLTYAYFTLRLKGLPASLLGLASNVYMCVGIAVLTFPLAFPSFHLVNWNDLWKFLLMGLTIQGIATTLFMTGLRRVKAQHASILCYLEALFATVFAALFLGEPIAANLLLGGLLIVGAGVIIIGRPKAETGDFNVK